MLRFIAAPVFYAIAIAVMYAPIVFQKRTLVTAVNYPGGVTEQGPWNYVGRKAADIPLDRMPQAYFEAPIDELSRFMTLHGYLPLWNPYQGAGQPLAAQYSTRVFFPFQILHNIAGPLWYDFFLLLRLWITAVFFHFFLIGNGLTMLTALGGGMCSIFAGSFPLLLTMQEMSNPGMMTAISLFFVNRLVERPTRVGIAINAILFALLLLSGNPEVILCCLILIFVFAVWKSSRLRGFQPKDWRCLILSYGIGMLLAAPLILPFCEFKSIGFHNHNPEDRMGTRDPLDFFHLLTLLMPLRESLSYEWHPDYALNGIWDFVGGFLGVSSVLLTFLGALFRGRLRALGAFSAAFGIGFILKNCGVFPFSWLGVLPLLNLVWTQRWGAHAWGFAFAIGAAVGLMRAEELRERWNGENRVSFSRKALSMGGWILAAAIMAWFAPQISIVWVSAFWLAAVMTAFPLLFVFCGKAHLRISLLLLLFIELWMWLPRGYLNEDIVRTYWAAMGCLALLLVFCRTWLRWSSIVLLVVATIGIDSSASRGPALRQSPFEASPGIQLIQQHIGHHRIFGADRILIASYASSIQLQDLSSGPSIAVNDFAKMTIDGIDMVKDEWLTFKGGSATSKGGLYNTFRDHHDFFSMAGVKYLLVSPKTDFLKYAPVGSVKLIYDKEMRVYENLKVMPRTFFAKRLRYFESGKALRADTKNKKINFFEETAIEDKALFEKYASSHVQGSSEIVRYEPNRVEIRATADSKGLLVLSDTFFPGWKARRNGKDIPIYQANGFVRAVEVDKGENTIVFEYASGWMKAGVVFLILGLLTVAALWMPIPAVRQLRLQWGIG